MNYATPLSAVLSLLTFSAFADAQSANWPQFRGADARGVADGQGLPVRWSANENVEWKTDIPGRGWSSPIVWGDRIIVTTAVSEQELDAARKGLYFGGETQTPEALHWLVFALDLDSGDIVWQREVHRGKPANGIHVKNSFASETPVTDGERIYAYFGNVGVFCLDFDGNILWERRSEPRKMRNEWGFAASPALGDQRVYIVNDNDEESYLLALDKETGEEVWRVTRDEGSNWATPFVWKNAVRSEIVTLGTDKVRSYDLDGKLLWTLEGMSSITIATPYEYEGMLIISSGYVGDRAWRPVYAIRPGAEGDISLKDEQTSNDSIAWTQKHAAPYNPSTLTYQDRLYVLYDRGLVTAFDARSGQEIYGPERIPNGRGFTASPWAYDGRIFCLNEDGVTFVLKAGDQFELLHANALEENDMGMATPAMAGDRLIIRTAARVYSIRESAGSASD